LSLPSKPSLDPLLSDYTARQIAAMRVVRPLSPAGIEEWSAMLPFAALDRGFNGVSRGSIWQHDKSVAEVLMDVSAHKCIHLVTA
jgi:hypothetical protein